MAMRAINWGITIAAPALDGQSDPVSSGADQALSSHLERSIPPGAEASVGSVVVGDERWEPVDGTRRLRVPGSDGQPGERLGQPASRSTGRGCAATVDSDPGLGGKRRVCCHDVGYGGKHALLQRVLRREVRVGRPSGGDARSQPRGVFSRAVVKDRAGMAVAGGRQPVAGGFAERPRRRSQQGRLVESNLGQHRADHRDVDGKAAVAGGCNRHLFRLEGGAAFLGDGCLNGFDRRAIEEWFVGVAPGGEDTPGTVERNGGAVERRLNQVGANRAGQAAHPTSRARPVTGTETGGVTTTQSWESNSSTSAKPSW